ncbi:hypothetical protein CD039_08615 [Staphylococcus argensis]|uniref:DUF443 domain-containing protein n=1 Tax=Staphylococcus argensis TaxID=1607738 RepID=A0A2K4FCF3_9STAP|nr:hypothetical protein CD039_08615 [Staphylococcus argensis]
MIIDKITIDTVDKNSKYKIVHYDNRQFLIDLNRNRLTYIFPLLNYNIRQNLNEISEEELRKIKSSTVNKKNKKVVIEYTGMGLGFFISVLLRPVIKYMYFEVSFWLNISLM